MQDKLIKEFYKVNMHRAGLKKHYLTIDGDENNESITFCYCEKGSPSPLKPSLIFIHGFSSNKYAWLTVIKNIPDSYHSIAIDMPGHGETIGLNEEQLTSTNLVDKLKQFLDKLSLTEPICLVGTSMGGSITAIFAMKYPSSVKMICLLAPVPPAKEYETEAIKQLRTGTYDIVLPTTMEQFYTTMEAMMMRKIHFRRLLANGYLKSRLTTLDHHKKILQIAFENDYPNLEETYSKLKDLQCPALIIWGRKDRLCAVQGAYYFSTLIPKAELIFFENCGHLILNDKPKETANSILDFWKHYQSSEQHQHRIKSLV